MPITGLRPKCLGRSGQKQGGPSTATGQCRTAAVPRCAVPPSSFNCCASRATVARCDTLSLILNLNKFFVFILGSSRTGGLCIVDYLWWAWLLRSTGGWRTARETAPLGDFPSPSLLGPAVLRGAAALQHHIVELLAVKNDWEKVNLRSGAWGSWVCCALGRDCLNSLGDLARRHGASM